MPTFFDTHAHLDFPDFASDLPQVVERAQAAGIAKIISIGTDLDSSARAIKLAERFACVYAVVGWHPSHVTAAPGDVRPALRELARHPKVVALGETGLDYHRLPSMSGAHGVTRPATNAEVGRVTPCAPSPEDEHYKQKQAALFRQHLEVAAETGLNCVIHQRDSVEDSLAQLQPFADHVRGVFHCFANDAETMRRILAMNSLVSFTGIVTFKNGQNVRDTVAATPLGQFMLETDCPYLAPMPYRGKRCEPSYVKEISETVARVKGCSLEELSQATCRTACEYFPRIAGNGS
ncbi:MAG: TatD family hydrolase [Verrucomicrobia bacterium]|nr:TatD family hydrolase [Verrucomicrobiota bacterium]